MVSYVISPLALDSCGVIIVPIIWHPFFVTIYFCFYFMPTQTLNIMNAIPLIKCQMNFLNLVGLADMSKHCSHTLTDFNRSADCRRIRRAELKRQRAGGSIFRGVICPAGNRSVTKRKWRKRKKQQCCFFRSIAKGLGCMVDPGNHRKNEKYIDKVHDDVNKQMPWGKR